MSESRAFDSILITGGAGYCGSRLVPQLLDHGYRVTVFDFMYFGADFLPANHPNLTITEGDIRDAEHLKASMRGHDAVLSLACISNDASFELDEDLSTSVNLDAFEPMVVAAKDSGARRFVYVSSSSVYGVSDSPDVTEDHPLVPLTLYNDYKGRCEPILERHTDENFVGVVVRPATVCGYAPRQRLDLSVNILTNHAVNNEKITVFGGDQLRPNLHVQDYCDALELMLEAPDEAIRNEIFNVGYENLSIREIADRVRSVVGEEFPSRAEIPIETIPSDDNRSYHINSEKVNRQLGFQPKYSVDYAVRELCGAFKEGLLPDSMTDDRYFNVQRLQRLQVS